VGLLRCEVASLTTVGLRLAGPQDLVDNEGDSNENKDAENNANSNAGNAA